MIAFLKTIIYIPLYNFFILILNIGWLDAGVAAVLLTVLVKLVLYPLAKKSTVTQIKMKEKQKELELIKTKYPDKQEQAVKTMEFYKTNKINPFASILTVLIQIPVIFSLYFIFFKSGLPKVDTQILYSFIKVPSQISMHFLGLLDVSQKSILLAILAAVSTFAQIHFANKEINKTQDSFANKEDFSQILAKQMKYTMPVMVFLISWRISGIVALYWLVSNLMSIIQDWYIKRGLVNSPI
jgi:YidC/Oxa1 family membrane protein insertase